MAFYDSPEDVYKYVGGVFRAANGTEVGPKLAAADIDLQIYYTDPECKLLVKMHEPEGVVVRDGGDNPDADVKLFMPADIGDRFWRGEYNLAVGLAKGQVKAKGPVRKILKLVPLAKPLFPIYKDLVAEKGRRGGLRRGMSVTHEHLGQTSSLGSLSEDEQELVRGMAAMLYNTVTSFGAAVAEHVHAQIPELPRDEETVAVTRAAGEGDARELLTMLRARLPLSAHETPVEALSHARFLKKLGIGLRGVLRQYEYGYAMFRNIVYNELDEVIDDPGLNARLKHAVDEYSFAFIGKLTSRLAAEYGLTEGGWWPKADDAILADPASMHAARRLREQQLEKDDWIAISPDQSLGRIEAEQALARFADTLLGGTSSDLQNRLDLADTTIVITLSDEPDLSVTVLLDRRPIEVLDGVADAESRMWITSLDLNRIWLADFYLPVAIARGRVRVEGPVRKFLRVVPILRAVGDRYHVIREEERA